MSYPILYSSTETDFEHNGFGLLSDCSSCLVSEEANGEYELEMEYPMDGIHFGNIVERSIIKAKPNKYSNPQLFRVYEVNKTGMEGMATVRAHHISYDLSGIPVGVFSAENAVDALFGLESHSVGDNPFSFWTDKAVGAKFSVKTPASIRSVLAGSSGSILDVYGGEYEFDNYDVKLWTSRGYNRGVSIRYGKNLTDIDQEVSCENVYTGVYPFWADTELTEIVELPEKVVNVEGNFDFTRTMVLDLSAEFVEKPTEEQIRSKTNSYIKNNKINSPDVSITVKYAQIAESEEYKHLRVFEQVSLFDEVNVEFPAFGVSSTTKVVKLVYDHILEKVDSITLGSVRASIADRVIEQETAIKQKPSKSELVKVREEATSWLTNGKGYKVERRDEAGNVVDTLYLDTPDIETAVNVLRIGQSGIGFSHSGVAGPYVSAWTIDGKFNADFIYAGIISSMNGLTKFNLDMGWLESADPDSGDRKVFIDAGKLWLYIANKYALMLDTFGSGGRIKFVNPETEEEVATINGADDQFVIGAENFYLTTRHVNGGIPRYRVQWKNIAGVPVLAGNADNSGKKVLYSSNGETSADFTVDNTSDYDLFAVKLGTSSTTDNTVVLAYKVGNTIRGVGGWSGDSTQNIKLMFLSATFSGDIWTVLDATSKELVGNSVGSATRLSVKEVIGII